MFENFTDIQATISHMEKLSESNRKINNCGSEDVPDNHWFGEDVTTNTIHPIEDTITTLVVSKQPCPGDEILQQVTSAFAKQLEKFGQRDEVLQQLTSKGASHPEKFGKEHESLLQQTSSDEVKNSAEPEKLVVTQDDSVNGPVVCSRTRRNVIYVFTKYVLPLYTGPENINKKDGIYYANVLNNTFYTFKFAEYIEGLKTRHKAVVTSGFDLEMLMDKKHEAYKRLTWYIVDGYRREISDYFTDGYLRESGIRMILESDNVIEKEYGTVQDFDANSCSGSLGSSFSAF
jgi:hypothetical protein